MMGVGGPSFDEEDDLLASNDDEDLQKDPISLIDLRVRFLLQRLRIVLMTLCRYISRRSCGKARRAMRMGLGRLQGSLVLRR
jgi:hypothetical protein